MRLIDADALRKAVNDFYDNSFEGIVSSDLIKYAQVVDDFIDNAPTIEERPKGKWIWEEEWLKSNTAHPAECQYAGWVCNQCHEFPTDDDFKWEEIDEKPQFEYCPNCGARMEDAQ